MAFVRTKMVLGRPRFYLVESRREGHKVRQRVLAYLGMCQTLDEAIVLQKEWIEWLRNDLAECLAKPLPPRPPARYAKYVKSSRQRREWCVYAGLKAQRQWKRRKLSRARDRMRRLRAAKVAVKD